MKHVLIALSLLGAVSGQTAPAPQFEVASVKPSGPPPMERVQIGVHIDGAQVTCNYYSLTDLIRMAYNVKQYQVEGPDYLASDRFNISAKLPAGAAQDQVRDMMKSLLADRFQLKLHKEMKDFPVYVLVVGKGGLKMKESEPDAGGAPAPDPKAPVNVTASGGRQGVNVNLGNGSFFTFADGKLVAKKISMPRFAEILARFEDRPVIDKTELKGNYDLELDFTPEDYTAMLIRSAITAGVLLPPEALKMMERGSGDSLLSAMEKLGLKMESRKAPVEVLVVDSALKAPTAN